MKLKHLLHNEDQMFNGLNGFYTARDTLLELHKGMSGTKKISISTKMDGAPSLVFGYHPDSWKFFVATKSAWNKVPLLNYSHDDIEMNHGSKPDLVEKLKYAFTHLRKTTRHGLFQGDIMYSGHDPGRSFFSANTITYVIGDGDIVQKARKALLGLCVHTQYRGATFDKLAMEFNVDKNAFEHNNPDVHFIDTNVNLQEVCYQYADQQYVLDLIASAKEAIVMVKYDWVSTLGKYQKKLTEYVNHCIKATEWTYPTETGFSDFLYIRHPILFRKYSELNHEQFQNVFYAHKHLTTAKDCMIRILNTQTPFEHYINGEHSEPEGYVISYEGNPSKLVRRHEFGRKNQLMGRFRNVEAMCV